MLKKHKYWLGLFWLVAIFVLPLPLIQTLAQGMVGTVYSANLFASQVGTIAYVWMLFAIVVSEKPKWIDKLIGLPEMYFVHSILGLGAIILAFWHRSMLPSTGLIKLTGNLALVLFISVALYSIFFMTGWLTSKSKLARQFKQSLEKLFRYETSIWIHRLNVVATLLVFAHVILISYITAIAPYMLWFYLYSACTVAVYLYMHLVKPRLFRKGKLISNRQIANSVTEVVVQLKRSGKYQAGDFVYLSFPQIQGMGEMHPFSIVQYDKRKRQLIFAIRNWGDFTAKIGQVPLEAEVKIDGSYGRLMESIKENKSRDLVFIGSGVGSVPLISLVLTIMHKRKVTFIRVASERQDLIYESLLRKYAQDYPNLTYYSQLGRLTEKQTQNLYNENAFYLIGGSAQMMQGTEQLLRKAGVRKKNIYGEKFNF